jgi:hypothetical protein
MSDDKRPADSTFTFQDYFEERKEQPLLVDKPLPHFQASSVKRVTSDAHSGPRPSPWNDVHPAIPIAAWSTSLTRDSGGTLMLANSNVVWRRYHHEQVDPVRSVSRVLCCSSFDVLRSGFNKPIVCPPLATRLSNSAVDAHNNTCRSPDARHPLAPALYHPRRWRQGAGSLWEANARGLPPQHRPCRSPLLCFAHPEQLGVSAVERQLHSDD